MVPAESVVPAASLVQAIEDYLARHPASAILEDGAVLFDLRMAHYAVSESHGRCLLQLWSEDRNVVRTVLEVKERPRCLRLLTRRMGAAKPQSLEIAPTGERRTPTSRDAARRNYRALVERVLKRGFPGAKIENLRTSMDLEHSFGPAYVRGSLVQGITADALIAVGPSESAASIDGVLTAAILWLQHCRERALGKPHFAGLKVIVPAGAWRTTAERIAWLNPAAARFELYTLDERTEEFAPVDFRDIGNIESRLLRSFSAAAALERCQPGIDRILALVPEPGRVELCPRSAGEVALLLHGLEFARARHGAGASDFAAQTHVTFGSGSDETPLTPASESLCRELLEHLFRSRRASGERTDPLFRLQPERWLEARLRAGLAEILPSLRGHQFYSQVPALSASDRGLLDLLTLDRAGRLVVMELKADEDLHLPLQALDYWIRVRALNADRQPGSLGRTLSAFERMGYFEGAEVSPLPPRLVLAAPSLRIHPANLPVLRYFSPDIEWELIGLSEDWRSELNIVFRKRSSDPA